MQKEYGKLSIDQLREFIEKVPGILFMLREMNSSFASTPATKFDSLMSGEIGFYCHVYEMSFVQHLSLMVVALGRLEDIKAMAAAPDPQEALLATLRQGDDIEDKPQHADFDDQDIVALVYSFGRTVQSMVTYGRSISSLLQDVRENNNQDSLFKAIRMDRSVIGCPTAMNHIAKAQIRNSKTFFGHLRNALKGPQQKPMVALEPLRYTMLLLREMGVNDLSQRDLENLFVDQLKIYAKSPGAAKNLMAQYQQSKKIPTI
jgi:hypothetical protein